MKKTAYIIAMITASVLILTACGSKKTAEPETAAEEITAAETTAEVPQETAAETEAAEETEAEEAAVVAEETEAAEEETAEEVPAEEEPAVDEVFSNGLFSITIPAYRQSATTWENFTPPRKYCRISATISQAEDALDST